MEALGSAFSRLPGFSPMMMVNTSETCATKRLLQCRGLGLSMNDVTRKFQRGPEYSPDLSPSEFLARKAIIAQADRFNNGGSGEDWIPILYQYEIVKGSAKKQRDWGHMIFSSPTTAHYLLVMIFPDECDCGNYSHHDYEALTRYHANKFMCLLKYLWHEESPPQWIRATYVTPQQGLQLDRDFVHTQGQNEQALLAINDRKAPSPMIHLKPEDAIPSLTISELERIDNVLSQDGSRGGKSIPQKVRESVLATASKPNVEEPWKEKNVRACAYCEVIPKSKKLMNCGRCKLVQYCGKDCQKKAWPSHKHFCKKEGQEVGLD